MSHATLTIHQLTECRSIFEGTPLILQAIADRYGIPLAKVVTLGRKHRWKRYQPPIDPATFEEDLEKAVAFAENEGMAKALRQAMRETWQLDPDASQPPPSRRRRSKRAPRKAGQSRVAAHHDQKPGQDPTNVVPLFPNLVPPPDPGATVSIFDIKTKAQEAQLRIELGQLRGAMSAQQVKTLQGTRSVIDSYEHYFRVYFRPEAYLEQGEMTPAVYQDRLTQLRREALNYIAPTERDTLHAGLKTLVSAREVLVGLERLVTGAGNAVKGARGLTPEGEELGQSPSDLANMDLDTLREIRSAMGKLLGHKAAASEPPIPPAPPPLVGFGQPVEPELPLDEPEAPR